MPALDAMRVGNHIVCTQLGKLVFGEAKNTVITERVRRLQALFDRAGLVYETPEECVRLLLAVIAEGVRYTSEAKTAAPERYRWIGRPLPEIVRAMAADLEEALARLAEMEEVDRG